MREPNVDLDPESRRALEFDTLLEAVAEHAGTEPGAILLRTLRPTADPVEARRLLEVVAEVGRILEEGDRLVPGSLPDPRQALADLGVQGRRVEPLALRDLASVLDAAGSLGSRLARLAPDAHPHLREIGETIPDVRPEAGPILRSVESDGTLNDDASRELRRIRRSIARVGDRLRRHLETFLRAPGAEVVIQDEFITQRNGRFVIPVRVDAPRPVRGIVHATSSSGATQFVEPMDSIDLNNDLVRLGEAEVEERERILAGWAEMFRDRIEDVREAVAAVASVDAFQARALFGRGSSCVIPRLGEGDALVLDEVRHPLLDLRLREAGGHCVPIGLRLDPCDQVLVISGPNAGGKTVALKILGLSVLMAQSGIPVPARSVSLPFYRQVRADIGDHQSIDADLSTFSAHVGAVARFLRETSGPTLLLFDEIGTGTEPREGAALARAVLEAVRQPGVTTVATTHHGELKAWAFTEPGAESAAMEFDRETLRPTYRVLMGAAGVSAGLEISARMGLDPAIVDRARELIGGETRETEDYLERLRLLTADLVDRRNDLENRKARLEHEAERLARREEHERERFRRDATRALEAAAREFRDRGKKELATIRERREREKARREQVRVESRLRAEAAASLARVAGPVDGASVADRGADVEAPVPGMRVVVRSLGREGEIVAVRGEKIEVRLGAVGFTVKRADLGAVEGGSRSAGPGHAVTRVERQARGSESDDAGSGPTRELLLIGKRVDEAIPVLDKFLDDAALSGYGEVRVVHGHGTGRLRKAVRRFLSEHPLVRTHRPGRPAEGGDGATVASLA